MNHSIEQMDVKSLAALGMTTHQDHPLWGLQPDNINILRGQNMIDFQRKYKGDPAEIAKAMLAENGGSFTVTPTKNNVCRWSANQAYYNDGNGVPAKHFPHTCNPEEGEENPYKGGSQLPASVRDPDKAMGSKRGKKFCTNFFLLWKHF